MTLHAPIPDYAAARRAMIDSQLRPQGVSDRLILAAMSSVARERFVDEQWRPFAYADRAVPIGDGRLMLAPAALGQLLMQALPQVGERALVIGAGTGYSAAVLTNMGLEVTALESSAGLASIARQNGVQVVEGPLEQGCKASAPYQFILFDGGIEFVPDEIASQLADGGRLAAPMADRGVTRLTIGRKAGEAIGYLSVADAGIAALPGFARPRAFTF